MEKYVTQGMIPIFGYPNVLYSPIGEKEEASIEKALCNSIMKRRLESGQCEIAEVIQ